jgi:uncharacterized protein (DUF885 family)
MSPKFVLLVSAAIMTAANLPAPGQAATPAFAAQAPAASAADTQLLKLFHDSDEGSLRRNPINALYRGDLRYADRLGDYISDAYFVAERAAGESDLKALAGIDTSKLSPVNQIAYDVFKWQTEITLKALTPDMLALTVVRPLDHFYGFQVSYPDLASGEGAAPFKTVADYENNLKRHDEYVRYLDAAIARFREGMKTGVVQPKLIVRNMIEQFDLQIAQGIEGSTFYGPVKKFPEGISAADQTRLKAAYAAVIRDKILPADKRMRDFLANDYLPAAREGVGLSHMKGGDKLYAYLIEQNTTLPLNADEVHKLGLSEVARIKGEMEKVKVQTGFKGSLREFFDYVRDAKQFQYASKEEMRQAFLTIGKTVDQHVRSQFSLIPKAPLEIKAVPEYREKSDAGGSYQQGTPDGTRPGVFYYNAYDLPSRSKVGNETLYLHEAVPGHHFQISLAQENEALPSFMRFGGNTAFVEGWALYAETLWKEMGVETDPYQRFGGLNDEMLRAMRLVVDTGLHAKGWAREQAIQYFLDNSSQSANDARTEVERYIAIPGQALAYKIGALTILRMKAKAQKELGGKFDARAFHAQVLDTGALPMGVLEAKIEKWIADQKKAG